MMRLVCTWRYVSRVSLCLMSADATPVVRFFFFLMIRRPPRSTLDRSSAASDVYKRQQEDSVKALVQSAVGHFGRVDGVHCNAGVWAKGRAVSYTHLRAHETVLDLVCRLLLEKKTL